MFNLNDKVHINANKRGRNLIISNNKVYFNEKDKKNNKDPISKIVSKVIHKDENDYVNNDLELIFVPCINCNNLIPYEETGKYQIKIRKTLFKMHKSK